jgi:glycosyltransferase involved in cell wall biosynthesis
MSLTVITPHYNMTHLISRCIESVQSCIEDIDEHIIVDDHSGQDEFDRLVDLTSHLRSCTLIRNKENIGAIGSCKVGLSRAKSSHIVFLAADDWLVSENIGFLRDLIEKYPRVGIVVGDLIIARQVGCQEHDMTHRLFRSGPRKCKPIPVKNPKDFLTAAILPRVHGQVFISRSALLRLDSYDSRLRWNCDLYTHQKIAIADGMITVRMPFTAFRKRKGSFGDTANTNRSRQIVTLMRLLRCLEASGNASMREVYIKSGQLWIHKHSLAAILRFGAYEYITLKYLTLKAAISCLRCLKKLLVVMEADTRAN